jgi:hypothetical protein
MRTAEQLARVDMPSAVIGGVVEKEVKEMVERLRQQWASMTSQALAPIDAEVLAAKDMALEERDLTISNLRKQIGKYECHMFCDGEIDTFDIDELKYVIKEQEKLMEMALSPEVMGGVGDLSAMMGNTTL